MSWDMNNVFIIGKLTQNPVIKKIDNIEECIFKILVENQFQIGYSCFKCITKNELADITYTNVRKNDKIAISGSLYQSINDDYNGIVIIAQKIQLLTKYKEKNETEKNNVFYFYKNDLKAN